MKYFKKAFFKSLLFGALLTAAMVSGTGPASATVVNFDDLGPIIGVPDPNNPNSGIGDVPPEYKGFYWFGVGVIHKDYYGITFNWPGTGYEFGAVSGKYVAYNKWAAVATVNGRPFVFRSAYLTAAEYDTLQVTVTGYRDGNLVYTKTVDTFMTTPAMFAFPADKVDTVTFAPGVGDGVFVLDDLAYSTIPVVDAGVNIEISSEEKNTVIIQGTASDEDGESLVYRWREGQNVLSNWQTVGPNGAAHLGLGPVPSFTVGDHTLTLEVKLTNADIMESDDMILTISNSAPHATPTGAGTYEVSAPIILGGEVSDYDGELLTVQWLEGDTVLFEDTVAAVYGGDSVSLPARSLNNLSIGTHTLTLLISDGINTPVSKEITVTVIDNQAPTLVPKPDKSILWPPFHQMVPVTIVTNAVDNSGGPVTLTVSVTSNEPNNHNGCHEPDRDWTTPLINQTTGIITLKLRAERNPKGKGREYTINITATDQSGNKSHAVVKITVARFYLGDCDYWWNYWHNRYKDRWNDPGYKEWFDDFYSDWFKGQKY